MREHLEKQEGDCEVNEKKVVTVIVEGPSDENAIGGILKEFFSWEEVQFAVVHGDITSNYSTTKENVVSKVGALIETIKSKYGYNWGDFVKIIHMEYFDIEEVEKRNAHKSEIMFKLYTTGKIRNIPYRLYFNSCNLEHVLYNELKDFSDDEKEILSDEFAEKYEGKVLEFIDFISDKSVSVEGTYKETWKYIEKDKNSLERHSNMHLIFKTD